MGSVNRSCTGLKKVAWNISNIDLRVANLSFKLSLNLKPQMAPA